MKKHKQNIFAQKFHLLSSQESEEIHWSSSDSSEFENNSFKTEKVCNFTKKTSRKRKRKNNVNKNISNLDITVIDINKDLKERESGIKSEISVEKPEVDSNIEKSPILGSSQYFLPYKCSNVSSSPIIGSRTFEHPTKVDILSKSPILVLKRTSPRVSPNVRKKLKFDNNQNNEVVGNVNSNRKTLIQNQNHCLDRRKCNEEEYNTNFVSNFKIKTNEHQRTISDDTSIITDHNISAKLHLASDKVPIFNETFVKKEQKQVKMKIVDLTQKSMSEEICVIDETPEPNLEDSMIMLKTSSTDLAKKVMKYFDNQFSSENPSQQTISEVSTPKDSSKTSDDVEIINIPTQILTNKNSMESKEIDSFEMDKKEKKIRYKKNGLAYRLNNLLKKQTASISLWQHERFLAENSHFVIPKGEFVAFRICKVNFKYGCHVLEAMDLNDDNYIILINACHFNGDILTDCIIKLYEPYTKIDLDNNCKLIINVTRIECVIVKRD